MKTKLILIVLFLINLSSAFAAKLTCKKVSLIEKSKETKMIEDLCFLFDKDYYISENCLDLKCNFMLKLKAATIPYSENERPGVNSCRFLGGTLQEVKQANKKSYTQRCFFSKDSASLSLNMLESWNGKTFVGPAPSVDFAEK